MKLKQEHENISNFNPVFIKQPPTISFLYVDNSLDIGQRYETDMFVWLPVTQLHRVQAACCVWAFQRVECLRTFFANLNIKHNTASSHNKLGKEI
jgi:hypothetical protein